MVDPEVCRSALLLIPLKAITLYPIVSNAQARADMNGNEHSKRDEHRMKPFHVPLRH